MTDINAVVTELNKAFEEFKQAQNERFEKVEKGLKPDPLLEEKLKKIEGTIDSLQEKYDRMVAAMRRPQTASNGADSEEEKQVELFSLMTKTGGNHAGEISVDQLAEYKKGFNAFIRKGEKALTPDEYKAITIGTGAAGGFLVQPEMYNRIIEYVLTVSPLRRYATVETIGTEKLEVPRAVGGVAGGWVGESGVRAVTNTDTFEQVVITAEELYALPEASVRSLDDAAFDVEAFLARRVARTFAQIEGQAFISGDGINKPVGLLDATQGLAGSVTSGAIGAFDIDDLLSVEQALLAEYRPGAVWLMNRAAMTTIRKFKDTSGQYLWQPPVQAGMPSTLLGYEVVLADHMPAVATGSAPIVLANLAEAYMIVDRHDIRVLRDPYSHKGFVQFYFAKRTGGNTVNREAGVKLVIG